MFKLVVSGAVLTFLLSFTPHASADGNIALRVCEYIKANDKGQSFICAVAHMNIAREAMETRTTVIEECDAGLVKLVNPVFVGDDFG